MDVLNYQIYDAPATARACLDNLRTFAVANGWTQEHWEVDVKWKTSPAPYEWVAGNGTFLQLKTTGYSNNQVLHWRMMAEARSATKPDFWDLWNCVVLPADAAIPAVTRSPVAPWTNLLQPHTNSTSVMESRSTVLSHTAAIRQWIFGNSRWLHMVVQLDNTVFVHMGIGVPELLDQADPNGYLALLSPSNSFAAANTWWPNVSYDNYLAHLAVTSNRDISIGSRTLDGATVRCFVKSHFTYLTHQYTSTAEADLIPPWDMSPLLGVQSWSGKRVLMPMLIYKSTSNNAAMKPFAYLPAAILRWDGLVGGTQLEYGDEKYLCFPFMTIRGIRNVTSPPLLAFGQHEYGFALRIE